MLTTRLVTAGSVGVLAFSLAACGGSSSSNAKGASTVPSTTTSSTGSTSATGSPSSSTSSSNATPLTKAQLQKIALQQSDVPAGWKQSSTQVDTSSDGSKVGVEFATCLGVSATDSDKAFEAESDFTAASGNELDSDITSFKHLASVESDKAILTNPKVSSCFSTLLKQAASAGIGDASAKISTPKVTVEKASGGPDGYVGAIHGTLTISGPGGSVPLYLDMYLAAKGQTELSLTADGIKAQVPEAQVMTALQNMLGRVPS